MSPMTGAGNARKSFLAEPTQCSGVSPDPAVGGGIGIYILELGY